MNQSGANANQQTATDWAQNNLAGGAVDAAAKQTNDLLSWGGGQYGNLNNTLSPLTTQASRQATASTSAGAPTITAQTGAADMAPYSQLYDQQLIDPSLKAFDYGTDRNYSALDARTAGAGAFANSRSGLAYSDLGAQSALQRGQLEAGLKTTGLNAAAGFGQQDASRNLLADTSNASNTLNNNQFNANLLTNNSQFNVNAGYQGDQQKIQAASAMSANLAAQMGLSQKLMDNIVTANGVDTQAAQNLFQAGTITQAQLQTILDAAAAGNGYSYSQNQTGSTTKEEAHVNAAFG